MRSAARRIGLGAATILLGVATGVHPAAADAPSQQGWWSAAGPATTAMGADVPSDGLLVQGGASADSPNAFAGLSFTLANGATPGSLTLKLAPSGNTVPSSTIKVCRLSGPFSPAQGGDAATAPHFDCANAPTGAVSGDHVKVDLSSFTGGDEIDIALVPAAPTDRVVLAKPDSGALTITGGSSSASAVTSSTGFDDTSSASSPSSVDTSASYAALPAVDTPALAAPDVPSTPTTTTTTTSTARSEQLVAAPASSSTSSSPSGTHAWVVFLFLGAVTAAALLWMGAGAGGSREAATD